MKRWRRAWVMGIAALVATLVVTLGTPLAWTPVAWAQGASDAIKRGDSAASSGKWEEALAAYDEAHKASPSATSGRKRANALYKLNRTVEAFEAYDALLRDHGSTLKRVDKDFAIRRRDELRKKTGAVKFNVSETGAQVSLDGKVLGTTPISAPVRVSLGKHEVAVEKPGFEPYNSEIKVNADSTVTVDASLKAISNAGTVKVTVKGGEELTVVIDGKEVGPAPFTGPLAPGEHSVSGTSQTMMAPAITVQIKTGETAAVELMAEAGGGTLDVRVDGGGDVYIDGKKVGESPFKGDVSEGEHTLEVKRDGYETFTKKITVKAGEVVSETVTLHKAASGGPGEEATDEENWSFDGLYGGVQFIGMFQPTGSGSTMDLSCDVLGATSCDAGTHMGGGLGLYIGYAFAPVGLELLAVGSGDVASPFVQFDGRNGSEINPLVAAPARDEDFTIGRFGGGGAIRLRLLHPIDRFRITGAIGAGLVYRRLLMARDGSTQDGFESGHAPDGVDYLSGVLSAELAGQVRLGGTTALAVGFNLWLEHAGDGVTTDPDGSVSLAKEGEIPQPHATPGYDVVSGTQLFIGPFLGLHFGP